MYSMKYLIFTAVGLLFVAGVLFADSDAPQVISWSLLATGSWEEGKTRGEGLLYNRGDIKLNFLSLGITLRGEILDRRPLDFGLDSEQKLVSFGDSEKWTTNYLFGIYHNPTGSRILFGVLDEWGLSARIRNPWIRSPPYSENHKPLIADLKTSVSVTKNDEIYIYLSSPFLDIAKNVRFRGFVSAQTEIEEFKPALSGGMEIVLPNKTGILFEAFFTEAILPPTKNSSWFTYPPPLPERDFKLYAAGLLFHNQLLSVSSDWALSETFAWGTDVYGNFGITLSPLLSSGRISRPLSISFAADGSGERFIYRDGANHGEGFRTAAKIEWKGGYSSLLRFNTTVRAPALGEGFNRSSTGFYYRFPAKKSGKANPFPVQITRISISADRNAVNLLKINDKFSGYVGFSFNLSKFAISTPFSLNVSGSISGLSESEVSVSPYPFLKESWIYDNAGISWEFIWSPLNYQFRSKIGFTDYQKKEDTLWDFSFSAAVRFKNGRLSVKMASPDFPEKWNMTVSWRLETGK